MRRNPLPAPAPPRVTAELLEARQARRNSTDALLSVIHQGPAVRALVDRVHEHGRRNHWAEVLEETMRRRHP